ncbi:MAG: hypothetical protein ACI81I_000754 [Arcobacteraceae bacterium]|jgi:hypothetical protein
MLKQYTPPYITILFIISLVNIISSTYFVSFLVAGVVFRIFSIALDKGHNYLLILCIFTFLIIENTQGLRLFSLTLISLFVYYLIMPRVEHFFSSDTLSIFLSIFSFYFCLYFLVENIVYSDTNIVISLFINFIIDILIVGLIL